MADDATSKLVWPDDLEELPMLGIKVNDALVKQGWCVIHQDKDDDMRITASEQARDLTYESVRREFVPDLLGIDGSGKVCHLVPEFLPDSAQDCLFDYDRNVTELCTVLKPFTAQRLGFTISGRTEGMVWMPYSSNREEESLKQEAISEDDIEDKIVEVHLHFLRRRRLTCMNFIEVDGGQLEMILQGNEESFQLPVTSGMMLVFCSDQMNFKYHSDGDFVILQSWVLEDPVQLQTFELGGDRKIRDQAYGILTGSGVPLGDRVATTSVALVTGSSSETMDQLWCSFIAGCDGQIRVPMNRFDTDLYFSKGPDDYVPMVNAYHSHGGLGDDVTIMSFDNNFFGIPDEEAFNIWPKQRSVLEVGYRCLHQVGITKENAPGRNIHVFIGDCGGDWYSDILLKQYRGESFPHKECVEYGVIHITATRLSFILGLRGGTISLDTACSSGLYSYNLGVRMLRPPVSKEQRTIGTHSPGEGAMAMGVQICHSPIVYLANCAGSMLTHQGRCFTFDMSADGYARGEGCGATYNQFTRDDAEKEQAICVNLGCNMNEDGRSASLTAPNGPSQKESIQASLRDGGISPGEVSCAECHGTGTPLGDPIEVGAIQGVHRDFRNGTAFGMTSSKSNLGHQEDNAGLLGMIKCILMAHACLCSTGCHLVAMNPNLEYIGYPSYFTSENMFVPANTVICGVSSFGFGGANAHTEVWGMCHRGTMTTGKNLAEQYRQITITCPVTLGQVDYLTGEPVARSEFSKFRPDAAVLREPLADYEVSRYAYDGKFRLRPFDEETDDDEDDNPEVDLPDGSYIFICGSWRGWQSMEQMEHNDEGWHVCHVDLGETRCESFYLCADADKQDMRFSPVISRASQRIWIDGPGPCPGVDNCWMIDGRDEQVPAGTVYEIAFRWGKKRSQVKWSKLDAAPKDVEISRFMHRYSVFGSWTGFKSFLDLKPSSADSSWEGEFRMGLRGEERFQIVRDHDLRQVVYPPEPDASTPSTHICGPDDLGMGKYFKIVGAVDEIIRIRFTICDAQVELSVSSAAGLETSWQNVTGWGRHLYYVRGTWSEDLVPLKMDEDHPGVFRCRGTCSTYSSTEGTFLERFQILIDGDAQQCFYPMGSDADSGRYIMCGPSSSTPEHAWLVRSPLGGESFEIVFDLTAEDRRKRVTWRWIDVRSLDEQLTYMRSLADQRAHMIEDEWQ